MRRGDIVTVALTGDYGKPRPALIVQSDAYDETLAVAILPITGHLIPGTFLRIDANTDAATGLRKPSQIMVDKITTVQRAKIGSRIGALDDATLQDVDRALGLFLGIA